MTVTIYVKWWQEHCPTSAPRLPKPIGPLQIGTWYLKMAQNPTMKATFEELAEKYGTINFQDNLADFIALTIYLGASAAMLCTQAADTLIPFQSVPVFHQIKFSSLAKPEGAEIIDSVVVWPEHRGMCVHLVPSQFDTVLVCGQEDRMHRTNGIILI